MNKESVKRRVFDIIQIGNQNDLPSRAFDIGLVCVIILNITAMFLETFQELAPWQGVFNGIESVTVLLFCVEYILHLTKKLSVSCPVPRNGSLAGVRANRWMSHLLSL